MSWQTYVDTSLIGTGCVANAAIAGDDCAVWAAGEGFALSREELKAIFTAFANPAPVAAGNFKANGVEYKTLRADKQTLYGRLGASGVVCCRTHRAVIVAYYDENIQPKQCASVTEKLAEYLRGLEY